MLMRKSWCLSFETDDDIAKFSQFCGRALKNWFRWKIYPFGVPTPLSLEIKAIITQEWYVITSPQINYGELSDHILVWTFPVETPCPCRAVGYQPNFAEAVFTSFNKLLDNTWQSKYEHDY
jgi:hypothetical protein